ncbi:MAG: hypothetical protein R3314_00990 [Longimicrobiales bacterium]|nr:hypothetical protein [Longimicrobiales bacterium]
MTGSPTPLRRELLALFQGDAEPLDDTAFDDVARRVFAHNFHAVPAYRSYCAARGRTPETVDHWTVIPAVPTAGFEALPLRDEEAAIERVFRTSGTTRGPERRGEHHVADLELYRASLRSTFGAFLLPDRARLRMVSLMPSAETLRDSSLAFMISDVMDHFGAPGSGSFADTDGLDHDGLASAVDRAVDEDAPILLLGTSSAFIHWLDHLEGSGVRYALPEGSRLMDTGGYKGRGRQLTPAELRAAYGDRLGLPARVCVNEYGMTELLSQYYDATLRDGAPQKRAAGWLRSVAVDPESLQALPAGATGLLRHVDLANLFSVAAVQTEDLGRVDAEGLTLDGRAPGARPRGCSIAMDLLLESAP